MLKNGYTLMHEHTTIDLSSLKNEDCKFDDFEQTVIEFKELYDLGVRNIVDVTNCGMGRNVAYVNEVSKRTNINIIQATGFYQEKFLPDFIDEMDVDDLTNFMLNEINYGIDSTTTKAQIIGEIGTSKNEMTKREKKVFLAAVAAHKATGIKISTHCTLGTYALEQIEFFKDHNVNLKNVVIGHTDLTADAEYILEILKSGVYIEFDTIGKNNYQTDSKRIEILKIIEANGYESQVFLSMDITRKSNLKNNGGIGYTYLFDIFIPMCLQEGISEEFIDLMINSNPIKFFGGTDVRFK